MNYKAVGDTLSKSEYNIIVSLLRKFNVPVENLSLSNSLVQGEYAGYCFDFAGATITDLGVLITDETLTDEHSVRLVNPVFEHSSYHLFFKVMSIDYYNLDNAANLEDYTYETLEIVLSSNDDEQTFDLSGFENGVVILNSFEVCIVHDLSIVEEV